MTEIIFDENEDWEKRTLCSDESCIGVIGADGRCKECGKVYAGKLPEGHSTPNSKPAAAPEKVQPQKESDDDWDNRVLCSDEACIGVIGADGKCKECGKQIK
ncbi:MAG TPA: hypothetical protein ENN23_05675 [Deltaproteobacteria bacterium]|nr:hypothetical protein [Deltaproteobacteria bacterium]